MISSANSNKRTTTNRKRHFYGQPWRQFYFRRIKMAASISKNMRQRTTSEYVTDQSSTDISIPGVNNLMEQNQPSVWRRRFWAVAILACTIFCVVQISYRIQQFLSFPISVSVDISMKNIISFPAVTICPFYPFSFNRNINKLRDEYASLYNTSHNVITYWNDNNSIHFLDLLDLPGVNVTNLWQIAGMTKNDLEVHRACQFQTKKNCDIPIVAKEVPTYLGTCLTLTFAKYKLEFDGSYNGMELKIFKHGSDSSYWQHLIGLHHSKEHAIRYLYTNRLQPIHPFKEITISFSNKEYRRENTRNHPCVPADVAGRCHRDCVANDLRRLVSCRLPFMKPKTDLPLCNSSAAAKHTYDMTESIYSGISQRCVDCPRSCVEKHYPMFQDVVMPKNCTWPKILMQENAVEVVQEARSYTFGVLLSDIGGSLGLFLGACILTGLQLLEAFALKLVNKVRKNN